MKKLLIKASFVTVAALVIGQYLLYIQTGRLPLTMDKPSGDSDSTVSEIVNKVTPQKKETAYKWVDEHGKTHYSAVAPEDLAAKKMVVNPHHNIMDAYKVPKDASETGNTSGMSTNPSYNPTKLLEDAKKVQRLLNEKYKKQNELLE